MSDSTDRAEDGGAMGETGTHGEDEDDGSGGYSDRNGLSGPDVYMVSAYNRQSLYLHLQYRLDCLERSMPYRSDLKTLPGAPKCDRLHIDPRQYNLAYISHIDRVQGLRNDDETSECRAERELVEEAYDREWELLDPDRSNGRDIELSGDHPPDDDIWDMMSVCWPMSMEPTIEQENQRTMGLHLTKRLDRLERGMKAYTELASLGDDSFPAFSGRLDPRQYSLAYTAAIDRGIGLRTDVETADRRLEREMVEDTYRREALSYHYPRYNTEPENREYHKYLNQLAHFIHSDGAQVGDQVRDQIETLVEEGAVGVDISGEDE